MRVETLDNRGLRFPECILKVASRAAHMTKGSILEVRADCPTFEKDMKAYCQDTGKIFLSVESVGGKTKIARIRL